MPLLFSERDQEETAGRISQLSRAYAMKTGSRGRWRPLVEKVNVLVTQSCGRGEWRQGRYGMTPPSGPWLPWKVR